MQLKKRAESAAPETLMETFVDVGPLTTLLKTVDHQIIYGRRGTGKTHALTYLANESVDDGSVAVYIDLRSVGSSGGLYSDSNIPLPERGTRLLLDVLAAFQSKLVDFCLADSYDEATASSSDALRILDDLAEEISRVRVVGSVETSEGEGVSRSSSAEMGVGISPRSLDISFSDRSEATQESTRSVRRTGTERAYVHFGGLGERLRRLVGALDRRLWVLIDEWSAIPLELQPLLADLLRRSLFPVHGVTVKIAAIEHRSRFREPRDAGDYLGIEVGADASANIDLDDFMVFGNDADKATSFFRQLLFRHVAALLEEVSSELHLAHPDDLVRLGFTQANAFDELVRAAEGVPRDAMNVALRISAGCDRGE